MEKFITLCMIVKNEEKVLRRCLDSIDGLVDEIIIVDTGSTDDTKKIASEFNTLIYDYQWKNNFASARNFAQSKASGKWIMFLDADEYVDTQNLKDTLIKLKQLDKAQSFDAYIVTQINFGGAYGEVVNPCLTIRIYKNNPSIEFRRPIHEQLYKKNGELSVGYLTFYIYHSGYLNSTQKEKQKTDRNVNLLLSELKHNENAFDYFNMGNEYGIQGRTEKALESYRKAYMLKENSNQIWVPNAVERIIYCLLKLERFDEALKVAEDASLYWDNIADFKCLKGHIYYSQKRYEDAEMEFSKLISNGKNYSTCHSINYLEYFPYKFLGEIYEYMDEINKAVENFSYALNFNDKDIYIMSKLYKLLLKYEEKQNIATFIQNQDNMKNIVNRFLLMKVLLDLGETELVAYFIKYWNLNCSKGFLIKFHIISGEYKEAKNLLSQISIEGLLSEGWVNTYDISILILLLEDEAVLEKLIENRQGDFNWLKPLFFNSEILNIEEYKSKIIGILQSCINYRKFDLFERIIKKISSFSLNIDIGNLLYGNGFEDLALDFYQLEIEDLSKLDEQSFVNIIKSLIEQERSEEALHIAYFAIENNKKDYRIFKLAIETLLTMKIFDDKEKLIEICLEYFPDSEYIYGLKGDVQSNYNPNKGFKVLEELFSELNTDPKLQSRINEISSTIEPIQGWLHPKAGETLYKLARFLAPNPTVVELGSWKGRSTAWLGNGLKDRGEGRVIAIDHWEGSNEISHEKMLNNYSDNQLYTEFKDNIKRLNLDDYVQPIKSDTVKAIQKVSEVDLEIGLLFIDASHEYCDVRRDFEFWSPLVQVGGYIVFDDVPTWRGPTQLVSELPKWFKKVATSPNQEVYQKI